MIFADAVGASEGSQPHFRFTAPLQETVLTSLLQQEFYEVAKLERNKGENITFFNVVQSAGGWDWQRGEERGTLKGKERNVKPSYLLHPPSIFSFRFFNCFLLSLMQSGGHYLKSFVYYCVKKENALEM